MRELRRETRDWGGRFSAFSTEDSFYLAEDEHVNMYVISLRRSLSRSSLSQGLRKEQGADVTIFEAFDGLADIHPGLINKYAGVRKRAYLKVALSMSHEDALQNYQLYSHGKLKDDLIRFSLHERLRFGCYLSHVLLWEEIVRKQVSFAIILEDDVVLGTSFVARVRKVMNSLPKSWGIVYFDGCFRKFGLPWRLGLHQSKGGLCTHAYAISWMAAKAIISGPALHSDKAVDHMLDEAVINGVVSAFHVDPPLVSLSQNTSTTLAY